MLGNMMTRAYCSEAFGEARNKIGRPVTTVLGGTTLALTAAAAFNGVHLSPEVIVPMATGAFTSMHWLNTP